MEIRGRRFGSLERVIQSNEFGWVGLGSLTDRRESVGTEDGGGIGDDDTGRDADGDLLLGVETRGAGLSVCVASTRLWRGVDSR